MLAGWEQSTKALSVKKKKELRNILFQIRSPILNKYFIFFIRKGEACIRHKQYSYYSMFFHFKLKCNFNFWSYLFSNATLLRLIIVTAVKTWHKNLAFPLLYAILVFPDTKESLSPLSVAQLTEAYSTPVWQFSI